MHCPSCGNESSIDQKFCRQCGLSLESVSKLVAGHQTPEAIKREAKKNEQDVLRRMYRWMMWGCLILLIGVVMLVSGKAFDLPKFLGPLSSFLLIGGAAATGYGVLAALRDGVGLKTLSHPKHVHQELPHSPATELSNHGVPISLPSVTERTTQLIGDETKKS